MSIENALIPRTWDGVIGHKYYKELMQTAISLGKFPHFSIFAGPSGIGKSTLAEIAGMALLCKGDIKPCGQCDSCKSILNGTNLNFIKINVGAQNEKKDALAMIEEIFKAKKLGDRTVYIMEEVHALKDQQTAFLEEFGHVPDDVYIMMCTTKFYSLIPELRGRGTQFLLDPPTQTECIEYVGMIGTKLGIKLPNRQSLKTFVSFCDNTPREIMKNMQLLGMTGELSNESVEKFFNAYSNSVYIELLRKIYDKDINAFGYTQFLMNTKREKSINPSKLIKRFGDFCLQALIEVSTGVPEPTLSKEERIQVGELLHSIGEKKFLELIDKLSEVRADVLNSESGSEKFLVGLKLKGMATTEKEVIRNNMSDASYDRVVSTGLAYRQKVTDGHKPVMTASASALPKKALDSNDCQTEVFTDDDED